MIVYVEAFLPLCALLAVIAWRWGGQTERRATTAYFLTMSGVKLVEGSAATLYSSIEWGVAALDVLMLVIFLRLSLRQPHGWLLVATALQLLSASSHLTRMVDTKMSRLAYAILTGTGGYPILISLAVGILAHSRRRAKMRQLDARA